MPAKTTIIIVTSVNTAEVTIIAVLFLLVSVAFVVKGVVELKKKNLKDKICKYLKIKLQNLHFGQLFPFLALALFKI